MNAARVGAGQCVTVLRRIVGESRTEPSPEESKALFAALGFDAYSKQHPTWSRTPNFTTFNVVACRLASAFQTSVPSPTQVAALISKDPGDLDRDAKMLHILCTDVGELFTLRYNEAILVHVAMSTCNGQALDTLMRLRTRVQHAAAIAAAVENPSLLKQVRAGWINEHRRERPFLHYVYAPVLCYCVCVLLVSVTFIMVAVEQFKQPWACGAPAKEGHSTAAAGRCGYVASKSPFGDMADAVKGHQYFSTVSQFASTTVRGSVALSTLLVSSGVVLALVACHGRLRFLKNFPVVAESRFVEWLRDMFHDMSLLRFVDSYHYTVKMIGYMAIILTGFVPASPHPVVVDRDYNIFLFSYFLIGPGTWFVAYLHHIGVCVFVVVPWIVFARMAWVRGWSDRWLVFGVVLQFCLVVVFVMVLLADGITKCTPLGPTASSGWEPWLFLTETLLIVVAWLHYIGREYAALAEYADAKVSQKLWELIGWTVVVSSISGVFVGISALLATEITLIVVLVYIRAQPPAPAFEPYTPPGAAEQLVAQDYGAAAVRNA